MGNDFLMLSCSLFLADMISSPFVKDSFTSLNLSLAKIAHCNSACLKSSLSILTFLLLVLVQASHNLGMSPQ